MGNNITDLRFILAGWLIDGSGGPVKRNQILKIRNRLFSDIMDNGQEEIDGTDILNLSRYTILPCLIDSHVHLFMSGTNNQAVRKRQLRAGVRDIKDVISRHINQHLSHGVIAVRDGGDAYAHTLRYKSERQGGTHGSLYLNVAGKAWHKPGGYGSFVGEAPLFNQGLAEAVASNSEGIDHVKIINSGLNSLTEFGKESLPQFNLEEMKGAVDIANILGLRTMVHANGRVPVKIALKSGCHSVEHGFFMGMENMQRMVDQDIFWVPTAYTMKAYYKHLKKKGVERLVSRKNLDHQLEQIFQAKRMGVSIALGTDAGSLGVHHGSSVLEELKLLMEGGFSLEEAIKCATLNGAWLLGLKRMGLIAKGMTVNFIAVKGGPSDLPDSLNRIALMVVNGRCLNKCRG